MFAVLGGFGPKSGSDPSRKAIGQPGPSDSEPPGRWDGPERSGGPVQIFSIAFPFEGTPPPARHPLACPPAILLQGIFGGALGASFGGLGKILGASWAHLERSGHLLGASWAHLEATQNGSRSEGNKKQIS